MRNVLKKISLALGMALLVCASAQAYHYPWDQGHDTTTWKDATHAPGVSDCPSCNIDADGIGSPIYLKDGHLVWQETDARLAGSLPLAIERTFNSNDPKDGPFGLGWSFNYETALFRTQQLQESDSGTKTVVDYTFRVGNGRRLSFTKNDDGSITYPKQFHGTLADAGSTVSLRYLGGAVDTFDTSGLLLTSVDQNGNTQTYSYDSSQRLLKIVTNFGQSLQFTYGTNGRVSLVSDQTGRRWSYDYDSDGRLIAVSDPLGGKRQYSYQTWQPQADAQVYVQLTSVVDEAGKPVMAATYNADRVSSYTEGQNKITVSYSTASNGTLVVVEKDALGSAWSYNVDPTSGLYVQVSDPLNHAILKERDSRGYVTKITDPAGHVETMVTDEYGRTTAMNDGRKDITMSYEGSSPRPRKLQVGDRVSTLTYDAKDNLIAVTDPAGNKTQMARDSVGRVTAVTDALGQVSQIVYDSSGYVSQQTDPLGRKTSYTRDALGHATAITNAAGETTSLAYDALDRVVQATDPAGGKTAFEYDAAGRLTKLTAPNGAVESYEYDSYGRLLTTTHYNGGQTKLSYRSDNLVDTQTNPAGTVSKFTYDAAKRLTQLTTGSLTTTYGYDARDLLTSAKNEAAQILRSYDVYGRLTQESINGAPVQYSYDVFDEVTTLTANGKTDSYSYDARGLLTGLRSHQGDYSFQWDALGRPTGVQYPNGLALANGYDAASQLSSRRYGSLKQWSYSYDAAGRITGINEDGSAQTYGYDSLGRLTSANTLAGNYSYRYDVMGNRTESGQTYDSANQILSGLGETFRHDANGNMVKRVTATDGSYVSYTYNDRERLIQSRKFASASATTPDWTVSYTYDPFGRRIAINENGTAKQFLWSGSTLLSEYNASGSITNDYVYGLGYAPLSVQGAAGLSFLLSDHLSTPQAAVSSGLALTWSQQRSPYGELVASSGTAPTVIGFPGQYGDGVTGTAYNNFRDYDAKFGRYIQYDPSGLSSESNPYGYADQNPIDTVDQNGQFANFLIGAASGVAMGYLTALVSGKAACYSWDDIAIDAAAGATGVGLFNFARRLYRVARLRNIAKINGMTMVKAQAGVEKYVGDGTSVEIKNVGNMFGPNGLNHSGSWVPRGRYKISPGNAKGVRARYQDPFTGDIGPLDSDAAHIPLEATPGEAAAIGAGIGAGAPCACE